MSAVKRLFVEFKSIFTGDDVLKENQRHANVVVATTMLNIFILAVAICIMTYMGIFNVSKAFMLDVTIRSIFTLFIPSVIALVLKGNGRYLKLVLLTLLTLSIGSIYSLLTYTSILLLVVPILLAARYYSKKVTVFVSILTIIMLGFVEYLGMHIGLLDLNYVELPKGTVLTIDSNILDAVKELDLNDAEIEKYIMLNSYLPKLFIYIFVITFACVQISQSGKNMIERQKELSEEGARINLELNIANSIQKSMLPSIFPPFPEHKEIDIYAEMHPAKEVGGDFYDMFLIDENHLAFNIADVSGKGVPAALIMMITKTLIKNTSSNGYDVDEIFYRVNNQLAEKNSLCHFVTSWFGILDLKTGVLEFVNAGHNSPLIFTKKENKFEYYKTQPNLILAAMENTKYTKHQIKLEPGDKIFLYTDGVTEATNSKEELFGERRLKDYLNTHLADDTKSTIKGLKNEIDKFAGNVEQFDDITMLELVYKGENLNTNKKVEKEFVAKVDELSNVISFVENTLKNFELSSKTLKQFDLVVEELFVNVASYAFDSNENGKCKITIDYNQNKEIMLVIEDNGKQFNPLEKEEPDLSLPAEERPIGGLGILLVKKTMDEIDYKYEGGKNILCLRKHLNK